MISRPPDANRTHTHFPSTTLLRSPKAEQTPLPRGKEKIDHDRAMARLAAEIHLRSERYAKRPKRKFVSASTTEYAWAGYLRAWVDRVERVGNLNYPDE